MHKSVALIDYTIDSTMLLVTTIYKNWINYIMIFSMLGIFQTTLILTPISISGIASFPPPMRVLLPVTSMLP